MGKEEVSVIVPVYNVEQYVEMCISSIMKQTYSKLQIILVDDGSRDRCPQICDRYKEKDLRITVIHRENQGLVRARKTGLSYASGKYVCYVDGDDWIEPDMIERLVKEMEEAAADVVVSGHFIDMEDGSRKADNSLNAGIYNREDILPTMLYTGVFYEFGIHQFVWAKLFRRDILQKIQMQVDDRIRCGEDVALVYPYFLHIKTICCSSYTGYHYIQRADSMTNRYAPDELDQNWILIQYLHKVFKEAEDYQCLYIQLNQYAKNLLLTRCISCFDSPQEDRILMPYGWIPVNARVILYGAGKLGNSISHYLGKRSVSIVDWVDRDFGRYQKNGMEVHAPERVKHIKDAGYDCIIIAVSNRNVAAAIEGELKNMGVKKEKIRWLASNFIKEDYFIIRGITGIGKEGPNEHSTDSSRRHRSPVPDGHP